MSPIEFINQGGLAMTRAEYLSNSAKLFCFNGIILFVANAFIFAGNFNADLGAYGNKLSGYTFYIIAVLSFLALNGESVGYKRHRDFTNRNRTRALKLLLVFIFLMRFVKKPVELVIQSIFYDSALSAVGKLLSGAVNTVATYSFLFTLISLLYIVRDKSDKVLVVFESVAFGCGTFYALYRTLFYAVTKYGLTISASDIAHLFSDESMMYAFSLLAYLVFVIMCLAVMRSYNARVLYEQDEKIKEKKKLLVASQIYNSSHMGLDTLEDDYLLYRDEK